MSHASKTRRAAGQPNNGRHFLSLSIDRLDAALKAKHHAVPRHALLEAVSAAFGFRASNAAVEAARAHRPAAISRLLGEVSRFAVLATEDGRAAVADLRKLETAASPRDPYVLLPLEDGTIGALDRALLAGWTREATPDEVDPGKMLLPVELQLQAWINDHAMTIDDGDSTFDAGPALVRITLQQFQRLVSTGMLSEFDNDALAEIVRPKVFADHKGPFEVNVPESAVDQMLATLGLTRDAVETLTDEAFEKLKATIAARLAQQRPQPAPAPTASLDKNAEAALRAAAEAMLRAATIDDDGETVAWHVAHGLFKAFAAAANAHALRQTPPSPLTAAARALLVNAQVSTEGDEIDVISHRGDFDEVRALVDGAVAPAPLPENVRASLLGKISSAQDATDDETILHILSDMEQTLARLPDEDAPPPLAPASQGIPQTIVIHAATISHRHGTDCRLAATAEELDAEIAAYVVENLHETDGTIDGALDNDALIKAYFEQSHRHGEYLERWTSPVALTLPDARGASHTPGPWRRDIEGFVVAAGDGNAKVVIADFDCDSELDPDEREANKALGIAAPLLARALQRMVRETKIREPQPPPPGYAQSTVTAPASEEAVAEAKLALRLAGIDGFVPMRLLPPAKRKVFVAEISSSKGNQIMVASTAAALDAKVATHAREALKDAVESDDMDDDKPYEAIDAMSDREAIEAYFESGDHDEYLEVGEHEIDAD